MSVHAAIGLGGGNLPIRGEDEITGTGFPKVFYLKYDMYRNAWPLLAFATYRQIAERAAAQANGGANGHSHNVAEDLTADNRLVAAR